MQLNTNYTMFSVKYKGPVHVIKSLIAEGGLSSLYKGYFYFSQEPFKAHWLPVVIMLRVKLRHIFTYGGILCKLAC